MNTNTKFISTVLPFLSTFKYCKLYGYELNDIKQKIAESVGAKNIHKALDKADFRGVLDSKISIQIIKKSITKLRLFDVYKFERNPNVLIPSPNGERCQIISFKYGSLPIVDVKEKNLLFFMYESDYKKVYYCGSYYIKGEIIKSTLNDFYKFNCFQETNYFTNFKTLKK